MPSRTTEDPDISAYSITTAKNGAFGYRAIVDAVPSLSGTAKTADAASAAARTKLRKHLATLLAAGEALPQPTAPPAPIPTNTTTAEPASQAPRLLELLAQADATAPAAFLEERRKSAAFLADFAAASRDVQDLFCDLLQLEGFSINSFSKALAYESDRVETDDGATAQIRAWTEGPDLELAIGAEIRLPRARGALVVSAVRAGLKRKSLMRSAEVPIAIHDSPNGPALHRDEVYAAFETLIAQVSLAAEAAREPDPPPEPTHTIWEAINDLYDRVEVLEDATPAKGKRKPKQ